jgi:hypothetical protein
MRSMIKYLSIEVWLEYEYVWSMFGVRVCLSTFEYDFEYVWVWLEYVRVWLSLSFEYVLLWRCQFVIWYVMEGWISFWSFFYVSNSFLIVFTFFTFPLSFLRFLRFHRVSYVSFVFYVSIEFLTFPMVFYVSYFPLSYYVFTFPVNNQSFQFNLWLTDVVRNNETWRKI